MTKPPNDEKAWAELLAAAEQAFVTMRHAAVFTQSREKMAKVGQELYVRDLAALEIAISHAKRTSRSPTTPESEAWKADLDDLIVIFGRYAVERSSPGARAAYADCVKSLRIVLENAGRSSVRGE
jgi:hypothetical protein